MKNNKPDDVSLGYHVGRFFLSVGLGLCLIIIVSAGLASSFTWTNGKISNQYVLCVVISLAMFIVGWCVMLRRK